MRSTSALAVALAIAFTLPAQQKPAPPKPKDAPKEAPKDAPKEQSKDAAKGGGAFRDTIVKKDGARIRGVEVTDMTWKEILYKKGSEAQTLPAKDFASVQWSEPPEAFATAMAAERKGDYETAANLFTEASKAADRKIFQLEARFLAAQALVRAAGDKDKARAGDAATALQSYVAEAGQGIRVPEAKLLLGRALRIADKGADAEKVLKEVEDTAVRENWGFLWDVRAKYEKALSQLAQGKVVDAQSSFGASASAADYAVSAGEKDPAIADLKMQAVIGKGEADIAGKKYDAALDYFTGIAKAAAKNPAEHAAAICGKGEAMFWKALAAKDVTGMRKAQIELANANLLDPDTGTGASRGATTAKALYYTGRILREVAKEPAVGKAEAKPYFESAMKTYPGTRWAALAKAELEAK